MAKKRSILLVIMGMIFGCLLATGIFAVVTKSVSFNLALKLDPQIYFSLSMRIDYDGDGYNADEVYNEIAIDETKNYTIFDNKTGADVVSWATVNQNSIVLNQVMAGNILKGLTVNSRFEITVTNLTETAGTEYLNLTLDYDGSKEVFKCENGYGAVNMRYGVASGEYAATKTFEIIPQTALLNGYIEVPFKAEIDTELRYTATITTENCEVVSAPFVFNLQEAFVAEFKTVKNYNPKYTYTVTINNASYPVATTINKLEIPFFDVTGNIVINAVAETYDAAKFSNGTWNGGVAPCFAAGDGTDSNPFLIYNAEQLALLAYLVNNHNGAASAYNYSYVQNNITTTIDEDCGYGKTFATAHYKLMDNITLNGGTINASSTSAKQWIPVGSESLAFQGVFNGSGFSISGLYITTTNTGEAYLALFGYINNAVLENVKMINGYVSAPTNNAFIASVCGYMNEAGSVIKGCVNSINLSGGSRQGGICAYNNLGVIKDCENSGSTGEGGNAAGICSYNNEGYIHNCRNSGTINKVNSSSAAGICASNYHGRITNCYNSGAISAKGNTGGICAQSSGGSTAAQYGKIINCKNVGTITTTDGNAGGICGYLGQRGEIDYCVNMGVVSGTGQGIGGVSGGGSHSIVSHSYNTATITATGTAGGRVAGVSGDASNGTMSQCYNIGKVVASGVGYVGGVCGYGTATISDCYNTAQITGSSGVAGVSGGLSGTLINCYNTGKVSGSSNVGGLIAVAVYSTSPTATSSYYLSGTASTSLGGTVKDATAMKNKATYSGWDFTNTWDIASNINDGYPYLRLPI